MLARAAVIWKTGQAWRVHFMTAHSHDCRRGDLRASPDRFFLGCLMCPQDMASGLTQWAIQRRRPRQSFSILSDLVSNVTHCHFCFIWFIWNKLQSPVHTNRKGFGSNFWRKFQRICGLLWIIAGLCFGSPHWRKDLLFDFYLANSLNFKSLHQSTLSMKPTMTIVDTVGALPRSSHFHFTISFCTLLTFPSNLCTCDTLWRIVLVLLELPWHLQTPRSAWEFTFHLPPLANDWLTWKCHSPALWSLVETETDFHSRAPLQSRAGASSLLEIEPLFVFFLLSLCIILLTPIYYHFLLIALLINNMHTNIDLWISFSRAWLRTTQFNPAKCIPPTNTSLMSLISLPFTAPITFYYTTQFTSLPICCLLPVSYN